MKNKGLNPAGWLAKTFITSKLTILFILACTVLGILAVLFTPREENPQIIVPAAEVTLTLPGAGASEVEALLIVPLERIISEIPRVDHIYSTALNSVGIVTVRFECGEDKQKSLVKLYDKVLGSSDLFPSGTGQPIIKSMDVDDVPIVTVTLSSEIYDDYALKRLADRMVERLRSLEKVSAAYVFGGRDREIRIELDPERLQAFQITIDQIRGMLAAGNVSGPMGDLVHKNKNISIYLDGNLSSLEKVSRLIVGIHRGRPIYLEDVADIVDSPPVERDSVSRFGFGPADQRFGTGADHDMAAVTLAVAKKKDTNAVFVANDILERIDRMKKNFVPSEVNVVVTRNDGNKADAAVNMLLEHLGIAVITVFIVIALFLGFKEALIVGITVPLILALTLGADLLFGPTINRITLFALILSLGMLVDAAIVVIENINRHYNMLDKEDDHSKSLATVQATNEIGNPTNLATFAIMVVFASLIFLTGMSGQYFFPITFNVPIAMFASLLVAYIVTPWAACRWLKTGKGGGKKHSSGGRLPRFYSAVLSPFLVKTWPRCILFIAVVLLIAGSLLQPAWQFFRPQGVGGALSPGAVSLKMSPKDNQNTFNIAVNMPESTPLEVTDQIARDVCEVLRKQAFVTDYQTYVGTGGVIDFNGLLRGGANKKGPHLAEIRVNLTDKRKRSVSSIEIVAKLRPFIENIEKRYPGSVIHLVEDPPGPPVRATLIAEIYGADPKVLRMLSQRVEDAFKKTYGVVEVDSSEVEDVREYRMVVDKEKASLSGVNTGQAAQALRRLFSGEKMGRVHIPDEKNPVPIRLHVPRRVQIDPLLLSGVFVTNRKGQKIPLSEVTRVVPAWKDRPILHKENEQVVYVTGELLASTAPFYAVLDLNRRLDGMAVNKDYKISTGNLTSDPEMPDTIDGYEILWDGEIRQSLDFFRDQSHAMSVSVAIIFLLLVGYYRSFIIPIVAMAAIPLGLIGVFPGHWLLGKEFSGPSMIGVIALAGVVVRNSLLIIDFVLDNLDTGMPLPEAVKEAGATRIRPILLTAMAVSLGSAIMLTDPVFCGLAISLIFGTLASTGLTVIVVPVLIYLFLKRTGSPKGKKLSEKTTGPVVSGGLEKSQDNIRKGNVV